jgi:ATP-dependent Clp protease ATP-binding subunit ClpB
MDEEGGPSDSAYENIKKRVMDAARSVFRPEFMNRVDEYIVFKPLEREQINSIVKLQVNFCTYAGINFTTFQNILRL